MTALLTRPDARSRLTASVDPPADEAAGSSGPASGSGTQAERVARPHWQGLDGLRAIAVAAVVVYHFSTSSLQGGFLGVDIFFVISGYLITRLLAREWAQDRRINLGRFYQRRARRLLPVLAVVLAAVSTAALIWRDQLATLRPAVLSTAMFSGNWWLALDHQSYFVASGRPSMLQHLWSLGVEEQFYLFWPLLILGILALTRRMSGGRDWSRGRMLRVLSLVALGLSLVSTGLTWLLADLSNVPYSHDGSMLYYGTDTHCMGLLLGAALGAWTVARHCDADERSMVTGSSSQSTDGELAVAGWQRWVAEIIGVAALVALVVYVDSISSYSLGLYRGGFLVLSAIVVVIIAVATRPGSWLGRGLESRVLRWVGVRSYSIYLWHWPIAVVSRPTIDTTMPIWLDQTIRVALTLLLSDLTYRFVEQPGRRLGLGGFAASLAARIRSLRRSPRPWAAGVGAGSLAAVALAGISVLVAGPSAPPPAAALTAGQGGRNLVLPTHHQPSPTPGRHHQGGGGGSQPQPSQQSWTWHHLPRISGFGDSVLLGAKVTIGNLFNGGSIDAIEGRQAGPILADVRADARAGHLAPLVVLHLGNNGVIDPADLQRTMQALAGVPVVLVLTDHLDPYVDSWQKPNNAAIERIVPQFPNAHVVNWDKVVSAHPGWLYPDDIHLRPAGAIGYANMLAQAAIAAGP
jgi:peptidoglycan/LPS O-acetylase OafA/YrhL